MTKRYHLLALLAIATLGACALSTHSHDLPPVGGECSVSSGEQACRSLVQCTTPDVCCEQDALGGCLSVCEPCCDLALGDGATTGVQFLVCQPIFLQAFDGGTVDAGPTCSQTDAGHPG